MTLAAPFPVPPLLAGMAEAMEEIRQMLLRYEDAMAEAPRNPATRQAIQDFDLAVQILQDLEHIAQLLAAELPPDMMARTSLPLAGLRLERSRRHFVAAALGRAAPVAAAVSPVDLFAPLTPDEDDRVPHGQNGPAT
jgi:hypothetical protein